MENDLRRLNDERDRLIKKLAASSGNVRAAMAMEQQYSKILKDIAKIHWTTGNPGFMIPRKKYSG